MVEGGKKIVPLAKVKNLLQKEEDKRQLSLVQRSALDHAIASSSLSLGKVEKLVKKLKELEHVDEAIAIKIADILPGSTEEVGAIFAKERFNLSKEEIDAILDIVGAMG